MSKEKNLTFKNKTKHVLSHLPRMIIRGFSFTAVTEAVSMIVPVYGILYLLRVIAYSHERDSFSWDLYMWAYNLLPSSGTGILRFFVGLIAFFGVIRTINEWGNMHARVFPNYHSAFIAQSIEALAAAKVDFSVADGDGDIWTYDPETAMMVSTIYYSKTMNRFLEFYMGEKSKLIIKKNDLNLRNYAMEDEQKVAVVNTFSANLACHRKRPKYQN